MNFTMLIEYIYIYFFNILYDGQVNYLDQDNSEITLKRFPLILLGGTGRIDKRPRIREKF